MGRYAYGLKLLRKGYRSLAISAGSVGNEVTYPENEWIDVPNNGAYIAEKGGLTCGGIGSKIALFECDPSYEIDVRDRPWGVRCFARVKRLPGPPPPGEYGQIKIVNEGTVGQWPPGGGKFETTLILLNNAECFEQRHGTVICYDNSGNVQQKGGLAVFYGRSYSEHQINGRAVCRESSASIWQHGGYVYCYEGSHSVNRCDGVEYRHPYNKPYLYPVPLGVERTVV